MSARVEFPPRANQPGESRVTACRHAKRDSPRAIQFGKQFETDLFRTQRLREIFVHIFCQVHCIRPQPLRQAGTKKALAGEYGAGSAWRWPNGPMR